MAATGLVLYGFVIGHMIGNLQIHLGPKALNDYAEFLQHFLHGQGIGSHAAGFWWRKRIWAAVTLTLYWSARPVGYRDWQPRESTYASRTMVWSGPLLAAFIAYHLAHFTLGTAHPDFVKGDVFNVVVGFQNPFASAFYVLAMLGAGCTCTTASGALQTLGLSHPRWNAARRIWPRWRSPRSWCSATCRSRWPCSPALSTCRGTIMGLESNIPDGPIAEKWTCIASI